MWLLAWFACWEAAPPPPPDTPPPAPAPAPPPPAAAAPPGIATSGLWGEIPLPVEDAEILSGDDLVTLRWPGTARSHHDAFAKALLDHDFALHQTVPADGQQVELYRRGAREVMLSVSDDVLTLQDFGGESAP